MLKKLCNKIIKQDKVEPLTPKQQKSLVISEIMIWIVGTLVIMIFPKYSLFAKSVFIVALTIGCICMGMYAWLDPKLTDKQRKIWNNMNNLLALVYIFIFIFTPKY